MRVRSGQHSKHAVAYCRVDCRRESAHMRHHQQVQAHVHRARRHGKYRDERGPADSHGEQVHRHEIDPHRHDAQGDVRHQLPRAVVGRRREQRDDVLGGERYCQAQRRHHHVVIRRNAAQCIQLASLMGGAAEGRGERLVDRGEEHLQSRAELVRKRVYPQAAQPDETL